MRTLYILFFTGILAAGYVQVNAQTLNINTDTLVWDVSQLYDVIQDSTMSYTAQFITYGDSKIVWAQHDNYDNVFIIKSVNGIWTDPAVAGTLEYKVTLGGKSGTISISRSSTGLQVSTNLPDNGKNALPYNFIITAVNRKL